jgi:phosphoglycerate dehydrogenase-like enzyme
LTRVWLPAPLEAFGTLPAGIEADVWDGGDEFPDNADQVEYVVLPLGVKPELIRQVVTLPRLKTVQTTWAGVDQVLPLIPPGVTLCNARGAHSAGTAEWVVGAIVASAPGLLLTPHVAGAVRESTGRAYQLVSEQLARLAAREPLLNVIGKRGY